MRRPDLFRDDATGHRQGTLGRGEVARPFSRRLRRILRPRPDCGGGSAGADLADAEPLRLDPPAAPGDPARRRRRIQADLAGGPFTYSFSAAWMNPLAGVAMPCLRPSSRILPDRKSTRLNSSH